MIHGLWRKTYIKPRLRYVFFSLHFSMKSRLLFKDKELPDMKLKIIWRKMVFSWPKNTFKIVYSNIFKYIMKHLRYCVMLLFTLHHISLAKYTISLNGVTIRNTWKLWWKLCLVSHYYCSVCLFIKRELPYQWKNAGEKWPVF